MKQQYASARIVLVGLKQDLLDDKAKIEELGAKGQAHVTATEVEDLARSMGAVGFGCVSALTQNNMRYIAPRSACHRLEYAY